MLDSGLFFLCGVILPILLLLTGIRYGGRLGFFYILHPVKTARTIMSGKGGFSALSLALAGTLGIGNIAGVSSAIIMGGPGAVFWMIVSAFVAMGVKYGETFFAVRYKKTRNGVGFGGAPYYITEAIKGGKGYALAIIFALMCALNSIITGNLVQINAVTGALPIHPIVIGICFCAPLILVLAGGVDKISSVTAVIIPALTLAYVCLSLYVIISNSATLPRIFTDIVKGALSFRSAAAGGVSYGAMSALRYGVSRGILSNEAGCGTSPIAHASAENPPHVQGCLGIFEVFADTVLLCTLTALVVLIYGVEDMSPISLVTSAFGAYLGNFGRAFIIVACFIFAFATLISQFYYGDKSLSFISERKIIHTPFAVLYILTVLLAPFAPEEAIWTLSDVNIAALTLFNLFILNILIKKLR